MLQLRHRRFFILYFKIVLKSIVFLLWMLIAYNSDAQKDTAVIDTVSMLHIDSITQPSNNNDDEYIDTAVKHIYDTSKYFFNWKDDFHDSYAKEKMEHRHLIDKDVNELKKQNDFWYVPAVEKMEQRLKTDAAFRDSLRKANNPEFTDENKKDFTQLTWFRFIIWFVIIGVFLAAIIYFLLQNKINPFSKNSTTSAQKNIEQDENIFHLSYNELIREAEADQNYRIAVRLIFLQTLKILSETNYIQFQPDYTNLHYLQQMHQSKLYSDFAKVTRSYEYIWYGKFEISALIYTTIKNDFFKLQSKIA